MRILFFGHKDRGVRCLRALLDAGHQVVAVVTVRDDDPYKFWEGSVAGKARQDGLPVYVPKDVNAVSFVKKLKKEDADLIVMSAYNKVLCKDILAIAKKGAINLHAGKLPDYRGGSPMNWAIINGETQGWATIHYCSESIDTGPILAQKEFPVAVNETIKEIQERTLDIFPPMLVDVVDQIARSSARPLAQDLSKGTYYCSRKPEDGKIEWHHMTAKNVYDFVRALTHPYPGAFTFLDGKKIYIWKTSLLTEDIRHSPGRVCMKKGNGRVVIAKDKGLLVEIVQPDGKTEGLAASILKTGAYLT